MRHRVLLAVLLSLVVSLSKASSGTNDETRVDLTEPATPRNNETSNETGPNPPEPPTPPNNGTTNGTDPNPPEPPPPPNNETTNGTDPNPPEPPTPPNNETTNGTDPNPPEPPTPPNNETTNGTDPNPPEPPTPPNNETTNGTDPNPPEPPTPPNNETTNGTDPNPPEPPTPPNNETTNGTDPNPPEPPTPPNNETTNGTDPNPPEPPTPPNNETTNGTDPNPPEPPTPPNNETTNGTDPNPPEPPTPPNNETTNGTDPNPPEPPTPPNNETTNGTDPNPPEPPTPPNNETTNGTDPNPPEPPTPPNNETTNGTDPNPPEPPTPPNNETTNGTDPNPPEPPTPPNNGDFCQNSPCGIGLATCVSLNSTFTCVCQYGFYYGDKNCHRGKIFPGVITLKNAISSSVQTVNSIEYEQLLQNLTKFFKDAFKNWPSDYKETVIVDIQLAKEFRNALSTTVTVTNLFVESSTADNATVASAIKDAAEDPSSIVSGYEATTYCAAFKCDNSTTVCEESMFPKCKCRDGFTMTEWDERSCSGCSEDCSEKENKYCANEKGIPTCKCMANFKDNKNGKCVSCPVGYSGVDCSNNSELILIIVGTVFGAIILALVIAISVISIRSKTKQDPEKKSLMRSGYANPNTPDERSSTMFPRVQTTSGHTNPGYQPNNPYEGPSSNRGPFPARDYEDLYKISREPEGFRMQRRY